MASIRIVGNQLALIYAERLFQDSYCRIIKEIHGNLIEYWIHSQKLESLTSKDDVKVIAEELIKYLNSILFYGKDSDSYLEYDSIKIGNTVYMDFVDYISVQDDCTFIENNKEIDLDAQRINKIQVCYQKNENLQELLGLYYRKGVDFVNLFRIYEKLKSFGIKPVAKGWLTREQESNFTNTANNPAASGDEARHGKSTCEPPKNPMSLQQAKQMIDGIIDKYIDEIYNSLSNE